MRGKGIIDALGRMPRSKLLDRGGGLPLYNMAPLP
jgi:hypothetical protein